MNIRIATEQEKEKIFALRFEIFVEEQNVPPEIELDEEDVHAVYILAEENGIAVGCARVILQDSQAHIGRFAVKKIYRRQGIGREICRFIVDYCRSIGYGTVWLNAQLHAVAFYRKCGFLPQGTVFTEAGIEHIKMVME